MSLRMTKTILAGDGFSVVEETLSDGEKVYNVWVGDREIPCRDQAIAETLYCDIMQAIHKAEEV